MNRFVKSLISVIIAAPLGFGTMPTQAETVYSLRLRGTLIVSGQTSLPSEFSIGTLFDGRPAGDWQILATDRAKSPPHVSPK
jgi:hypothetical protein